MIEAKGLLKSFGRRGSQKTAVDNLSFKVSTGKVTGFLGPNGAGKSTTMRLMLGLDKGKGLTTFDSKELNQYDNPSKMVGVLLEAKAFHPTRSARNHLKILASEGNIPHSRVDEVLEMVGLSDVAKKGPGKFSLGMSQRLGLAAAILAEPKYLILDEPANGLDPEGIAWLRHFLRDYAKQGRGVLISSHLLSEMSQMADEVVVIGKGRLIVEAPTQKLLSGKASSVFVRVKSAPNFEKALKKSEVAFQKEPHGYIIHGKSTDDIGMVAYRAASPILELTPHGTSLEEAFLELTESSSEYEGKKK